ncbi:MAG: DUF2589 domain-containing protein [Bacteroidales bacterium]|nr:DUF2589 domain-containing protein [Bacteroidales bacterium]
MAKQNPIFLDQLIGLPLEAIIKGETYAAQATLDFIKNVGFDKSDEFAFGDLRMITFRYKTNDENGEPIEAGYTVPLLSLVPIPLMQISEANISYSISISSIEGDAKSGDLKLMTTYATDGEIESSYNLKIDLKLEQSDIPLGLSKIFSVMDNQVTENP